MLGGGDDFQFQDAGPWYVYIQVGVTAKFGLPHNGDGLSRVIRDLANTVAATNT